MRRFTLGALLLSLIVLGMPAFPVHSETRHTQDQDQDEADSDILPLAAKTVTVHVYGFKFSINPQGQAVVDPVIFPGDTIHWVWDQGGHNTASNPNQAESWSTAVLKKGSTFDKIFTKVGVFTYVCTPHKSFMTGKVTVLDPSLTLKTLVLKPVSVKGGIASVGTVTLMANAKGSGTVVKLSSNSAKATVPASITIAAGKKLKTFKITTKVVTATTTVTIKAQVGTATPITATLTLTK